VNKTDIECVLDNMVIKDIGRGRALLQIILSYWSFVFNLCDTLYNYDRRSGKCQAQKWIDICACEG
jgi:hypothetical protein